MERIRGWAGGPPDQVNVTLESAPSFSRSLRKGGRRECKQREAFQHLTSPGFPNWNQIRPPTAFLLTLVPYLRSDVNTEVIYKIICILDNLSIEYFPKWNRADDGAMNSNVSNIVSGNYSKNHRSSRQEKSRPFVF
jgi:hypothetical protein